MQLHISTFLEGGVQVSSLKRVGFISNLIDVEGLTHGEGYAASIDRYMEAVGGNTGNLAFVHGTRKCLANPIIPIGWGTSAEYVKQNVDVVVVSCANQVGAHADLTDWYESIERFDKPVVLVGLGAQTPNYEANIEVPESVAAFLTAVSSRRAGDGSNIAVRGDYSKSVLANLGFDSEAIGCPSLYISAQRELGQLIAQRSSADMRRIAVAAGNPFHPANREVESRLVEVCERYNGAYVVQHPAQMVDMALDGRRQEEVSVTDIAQALGFAGVAECRDWFDRNAYSFHETQAWIHFLRHYDGAVGARYHGIALAVQAGVPGVVVHIDNRTSELSSTTMIPSIRASDISEMSAADLVAMVPWSLQQALDFDENRQRRASWMADFLAANDLQPSEQLLSLA